MRVLVVILILANLGFAAWALLIDQPSDPPIARSISHLTHLVLASEPLPGAEADPAPTPAPAPDPPPVTAVPAPARPTVAAASPPPRPVAAALPSGRCQTVGPFTDPVLAAAAATFMESRGLATTQRDQVGQDKASYWVHLDDVPTEAAANRLVLMLRAIGLADAHTMPVSSPAAPRRVSLGLFSAREGADRRAHEVETGLGQMPVISEQHSQPGTHWVDFMLAPDQQLSKEALLAGVKGSHVEVRNCPGAPKT